MPNHLHRSALRAGGVAGPALALLLLVLVLPAFACAPASRWRASAAPRKLDVPVLLESRDTSSMQDDIHPEEISDIPIRKRLRPCCAFGSELRAKLGPIPVPFYSISNVIEVSDIGPHSYDSGVLLVRYGDAPEVLLNEESNGLVYTCRGGFIDIAHVRDYADWSIFLVARLAPTLETGTAIELGEEGGDRRIVTSPIPPGQVERMGRRQLAMGMAAWLAFEMSLSDFARLEIDVPKKWAEIEPWKRLGPRVTQRDFPVLLAFVRGQSYEKLGPSADRPD